MHTSRKISEYMDGQDTQGLVSATLRDDDEQRVLILRLGPQAFSFATALNTRAEILAEIERSLPAAAQGDAPIPAAILDLRDVPDLGSYGDGIFVSVFKRLIDGHGAGMALAGASESVQVLLALCRLDQVFPSYPDVPAALADIRAHMRLLATGCPPAFAFQVAAISKRRWKLANRPVAPPGGTLH